MPEPGDALAKEHKRFVHEYLKDLNSIDAAIRIGRGAAEAKQVGAALLRVPAVTEAIAEALAKRMRQTTSPSRMLRHVATRSVPLSSGLKRAVQKAAARRGIAIMRLPRQNDSHGATDPPPADEILHAYYQGRCFHCIGNGQIARHVLRGLPWDAHLKRILSETCARHEGGIIVEVGANIGASFLTECAAHPAFQFVLIEPLPIFFRLLEMNAASFEAKNVTLHNLAVSDGRSGDVIILYDDESGGVAAASSALGRQHVAVVESTSLDELFPDKAITLLKVDVDGYELDVMRGGRSLIARSKPDVLFEYNPLAMEVRGVAPGDLPEFLSGLGLGMFRLYTSDGTFIEATAEASRLWTVFESLKRPLDYLDVHACARP